jgi:hypothetical protein
MGALEPFTNVDDTKVILQYKIKLWTSIKTWIKNMNEWNVVPFKQIDVERILEESNLQAKIVLQCERNLPKESTAV